MQSTEQYLCLVLPNAVILILCCCSHLVASCLVSGRFYVLPILLSLNFCKILSSSDTSNTFYAAL